MKNQITSLCCTLAVSLAMIAGPPAHTFVGGESDNSARPVARGFAKPLAAKKSGGKSGLTVREAGQLLAASATPVPAIYGSVVYSDLYNWEIGMYAISPGDADSFASIKPGVNATWGGLLFEDSYYAFSAKENPETYNTEWVLEEYDPTDWSLVKSEVIEDINIWWGLRTWDAAYDPATGWAYGSYISSTMGDMTPWFKKVNYRTKEIVPIRQLDTKLMNVAVDNDGTLYGIALDGNLYKINKETGDMTPVGATGFMPQYASSMAVDPDSGRMFASASPSDGTGRMYEIDKATGAATLLRTYSNSNEICGLYIPSSGPKAGAPGDITGLTLSFPNGSLAGSVTFTLPSTLVDGSAASGSLDWEVKEGREVLAHGSDVCGKTVVVPVTFTAGGKHTVRVTCSNDAGTGNRAEESIFVGPDAPDLGEVKLTYDYTAAKLKASWTKPSTTLNGGYFDPTAVTYRVTLQPAGTVLAESTRSNEPEFDMPVPQGLGYYNIEVLASYSGAVGVPVASNKVRIGYSEVPFYEDYDTREESTAFTVIDVNGDAVYTGNTAAGTWYWDDNGGLFRASHYRADIAMDDWLIAPPVRLEKGKYYVFKTWAHTFNDNPENWKVCVGNAPAPEAMTTVIFDLPEWKNPRNTPVSGYFTVPEDGLYYTGAHSYGLGKYSLFVDNFEIDEVNGNQMPLPVENLTAEAVAGTHDAVVRFTTPTKTVAGTDIRALTKVEIYRMGQVREELLATIDNPAPGTAQEWRHENAPIGDCRYRVYAYMSGGRSEPASFTAWIGAQIPNYPENVVITENHDKFGEVTMTWDHVTTAWNGEPMDEAYITYNMQYQVGNNEVVTAYTATRETSYTFQAIPEGEEQDFVGFQVQSESESGKSVWAASAYIPVGKPYDTPYRESFAGGGVSSIFSMGTEMGRYASWRVYQDQSSMSSSDGDNGFVALVGAERPGDAAYLTSAKISLAGLDSPVLMFDTYVQIGENGEDDINTLKLRVKDAEGWHDLGTVTMSQLLEQGRSGWTPVMFNLSPWKGKAVQIDFIGTVNRFPNVFLDNIFVGQMDAHSLVVEATQAAEGVDTGEEFAVNVKVANRGANDEADYVVELYRDGEWYDAKFPDYIPTLHSRTVTFTDLFDPSSPDKHVYRAAVVFGDDQNNQGEEITVYNLPNDLPAPVTVQAAAAGEDVLLTWGAPATQGVAVSKPVLDDFESYEPFAWQNVGQWTFVDLDQAGTGGVGGVDFPNIPGMNEGSLAWFVMDNRFEGIRDNYTFDAFSGNQYLASMFRADDGEVDDWLISPELSGKRQTIRLSAKSYIADYPEIMEVLYSTTGTAIADFKSLARYESLPAEWNVYNFMLPEGAKYFAVRSNAVAGFMLFVDDVRYKVLSTDVDLHVTGYNVWRDGVKITPEPVAATAFTDAGGLTQDGTSGLYRVTAIYDRLGESQLSDGASVKPSSLNDVVMTRPSIAVRGRTMVVSAYPGCNVDVYRADGTHVYRSVCDSPVLEAELPAGVYVAKAGTVAAKIVIP